MDNPGDSLRHERDRSAEEWICPECRAGSEENPYHKPGCSKPESWTIVKGGANADQ